MPWRGRSFQTALFSHRFNDDAFRTPAVELGVVDLLPGSEVELSVGDRDDDFVVYQEAFEVRIAVRLAGAVVAVVAAERGKFFEPLVDVGEETVLSVIDPNSGGDVHGGDEDHALLHAALAQDLLHLWSDIDVLSMLSSLER